MSLSSVYNVLAYKPSVRSQIIQKASTHHQISKPPKTIEPAIIAAKALRERAGDAASLARFLPVPVADTATTEPIVADGTGAFPPLSDVAVVERLAKPTEGGLKRNTE